MRPALSAALLSLLSLGLVACERDDTSPGDQGGSVDADTNADTDTDVADCGTTLASTPRNLLMISIDTLRRDYVGHYGGDNTAFLDQLLDQGLTLDDHRSCANWTYPSALCALTGRYNEENAFFPLGGGQQMEEGEERNPPLPDEVLTLADWMGQQGFVSGLVAANGFLSDKYNIGSRYDLFEMLPNPADVVVSEALSMADELHQDGRPWFLHAHFIDPHTPYDPPPSYVEAQLAALPEFEWDIRTSSGLLKLMAAYERMDKENRALAMAYIRVLYGGEIAFLDDQLQRMIDSLEDKGALEDTLVVVWSDHGEQFWEHDRFGHHADLYAEETLALAAFWANGMTPAAWEKPTNHIDLIPTLLCMMDLPPFEPGTGAIAGSSTPDRPVFSSVLDIAQSQSAVEVDGLRLVYRWTGRHELYRLDEDPSEQHNTADDEPDEVEALWALLEPFVTIADALNPDQEALTP